MELTEGQPAPDFQADASTGQRIGLSDFRGKWLILYFYPKDETPGCTRQACELRDKHAKLQSLNAVVIGCSPDDLRSHDKFIAKHDLPFTLLSDPDHTIAADYGVWKEKNMYGRKIMGTVRSTFLIDPAGDIAKIWYRVKLDGHVDELIDEMKMVTR